MNSSDHSRRLSRGAAALVACLLLAACAARLVGVLSPQPTFGGEKELVAGIESPDYQRGIPRVRYYPHALEARALTALGLSAGRAAHLAALLAGLGAIGLGAWAAARLFGRRAGWACLGLCALSATDLSFSVKIHGVAHAALFLSLAILLFSFRARPLWAAGAVALALAFIHRYHVGLVAVTFGVALAWTDLAAARAGGGWRRLLHRGLDRAWVAALAVAVVIVYDAHTAGLYPDGFIAKMTAHENLAASPVQSNFRWLGMVVRLDPVIWPVALLALLLLWRRSGWRRPRLPEETPAFVSGAALMRWAILLIAALTLFRGLSGMLRQVFPALVVMRIAVAPLLTRMWEERAARRWCVPILAAALLALGAAAWDCYVGKGLDAHRKIVMQHLRQRLPDRQLAALHWDHFVWSQKGVKVVEKHGRAPDLIVGGDRWFLFLRMEEEPRKLSRVDSALAKHQIADYVGLIDLVHTTPIYVTPPLSPEERDRLIAELPLSVRLTVRAP